MDFKSLPQLLEFFKDENTCIKYYEQIRWNGNPTCPHCNSEKPYITNRGYKCSDAKCKKKFTVKVGTIFENSKISFKIWFAALFLANAHKKGITSTQLAIDLGITQKTAWFVLHRLRVMFENVAPEKLREGSIVECDESYIGGKEKNRHWGKRRNYFFPDMANDGTLYNKKKVVFGMIERGGNVILKLLPAAKTQYMLPMIEKFIPKGNLVITDEHYGYSELKYNYNHAYVNHSAKNYVIGKVYTNTIESFWSLIKRGIFGVYHNVSTKHLQRYLHEYATRHNMRNFIMSERFKQFLSKSNGRLTYKRLTL